MTCKMCRRPRFRSPAALTAIALGAIAVGILLCATHVVAPAAAETTLDGREFRTIVFPVVGPVTYTDDFGACRDGCARRHQGNDLMGSKMLPLVAAFDGRVTSLHTDSTGRSGNMLTITDADGWSYVYIHVNNDTPGTDDNRNPPEHAFPPGIAHGVAVVAGETVAWMGDSGNAESTQPHLHFEIHRPDDTVVNPYLSLQLAQGVTGATAEGGALETCTAPPHPAAEPDSEANPGYWSVDESGTVAAFGRAADHGGRFGAPRSAPIVAIAPTATGAGYWLVDSAGVVYGFGDASYYGSLAGVVGHARVTDLTSTTTGRGYWLTTEGGAVFNFGDAAYHGSVGTPTTTPVVAMEATPTDHGYWLVDTAGTVFSFGDAQVKGSIDGMPRGATVIDIARNQRGSGYWLLDRGGSVFAFGDATYAGSIRHAGACLAQTAAALVGSNSGLGYWILTTDGHVLPFGDAVHHGDQQAREARPIALAAAPR